ncbi:DUF3891 family protein [Tellurirhabdus rosea]|uniref:DUF3891 family protein n=1 Tax=Tellurirhabdus rosea TaxID=2674997 RepID=UPI0022589697|nr:DUF3891 family protein [Tellurirhabdus rosea]
MIVRSTEKGWEVIHQQAHGLLALQAAMRWHPDRRPVRWPETLVALSEHDDGQDEWEGSNHLTEAGAPKDFQILNYSVSQAKKMVSIALEKSRWNALMVSMHASFLYEPLRRENRELDAFLNQQQKNQQDWIKVLKTTRKEVQYGYDFLQWCDALSLILVQNQLPPESRRLEISIGPDGVSYYILQRPDQTLAVEPWPFDCDEFEARVEVYQLSQLSFKDDPDLYNALLEAPIEERCWIFRK